MPTLNGRNPSIHRTEHRPKHIGLRPASLPPSPGMRPPEDRDSTKVLVMSSGRAGIIFARGVDGKRPPQKLCDSLAIAEAWVRDYKLAKPFIAALGWLANFLPRACGGAQDTVVSKSGLRVKPSDEVARRKAGR